MNAAPQTSAAQLDVFFGDELVGTVHDTAPLSFIYCAAWLARAEPAQIAAIVPTAQAISSPAVTTFFENLLPEGELRHFIASSRQASTLFALLREVAGDTAGGFVILSALVAIGLFAEGVPQLPLGASPSTHILKPDIGRLAKVWHSAANEAVIMRAAALCGLPTAEVFYEPHTQACVVKRFDRVLHPDGTLGRVMQYDLCQLSTIASDKKYEKEGGPGVAHCARLIRHYSALPAVDLKNSLSCHSSTHSHERPRGKIQSIVQENTMTATAPTKSKPHQATVAATVSPSRGRMVRVMTNDQLIADIKAHGREIRKTKESAIAFLQRAGIVDKKGELAEPYRA